MVRFYLIGFVVLMAFDSLAQISFKYTALHALPLVMDVDWLKRVFGQPWVYGALLGYIGSFFTWMTLLKKVPIGPAFAASHLEIISVMIASAWLFHEPMGWSKLAGAGLIFSGICCLAYAESLAGETAARDS